MRARRQGAHLRRHRPHLLHLLLHDVRPGSTMRCVSARAIARRGGGLLPALPPGSMKGRSHGLLVAVYCSSGPALHRSKGGEGYHRRSHLLRGRLLHNRRRAARSRRPLVRCAHDEPAGRRFESAWAYGELLLRRRSELLLLRRSEHGRVPGSGITYQNQTSHRVRVGELTWLAIEAATEPEESQENPQRE